MNNILQHVDEGELQSLIDGELDAPAADRVEAHLTECGACRAEVDSLQQASMALSGALRELDRPAVAVPPFRAPAARPAAMAGGWGALPRAAVLVLGLAGAASAAIPGSPVRAWVESLAGERAAETPAAVAEGPGPERAIAGPEAGVSVAPEAGTVRVVLNDVAADVLVTAVLTDGPRAGVYATGAAAEARFTTGRGRIDAVGAASGTLRVEIPRDAVSATVIVNGRTYVVKDGDRLRGGGPDAETAGDEVTFRMR